jgi:hypothetical protein
MTMSKQTKTTAANVRRYYYTLSRADKAVIAQMGGTCRNTAKGCTIDADTAQKLADVCRCSCGAAGGFCGFIYYSETRDFVARNRAAIIEQLHDQIAAGLFSDENGRARGVVAAVMSFNCLKDEDPAEVEEIAARCLFGRIKDIKTGALDLVANALAWAALESLAFALDGQEMAD